MESIIENPEISRIHFEAIIRETDKAYQVRFPVYWRKGVHTKTLWIPKALVRRLDNADIKEITVPAWYAEKLQKENAFEGYDMNFYASHTEITEERRKLLKMYGVQF